MSSISSNQSSVGNLILASNRLATSRRTAEASNLPVFGKPSVPASGDLKGLYGQLAKSFLARRSTAATDNKQSALAAAATAATANKSTSTSSSSNADGDSVSLTKSTSFKKYVRSNVVVTPPQDETPVGEPTPEPAPTPTSSVTELDSGSFDLENGAIKVGGVEREGDYTYTDGVSRINFTVLRADDGTLKASGQLFRDANKDQAEEFSSELFSGTEIRLSNYGQSAAPAAQDPKATAAPAAAAAVPAAATTPAASATPVSEPAQPTAAQNAAAAQAANRERVAANLSSRLEALGASGISNNNGQLEFTLNGTQGRLELDETGRTVTGRLGNSSSERVEFTLDAEGTLTINAANDQKDTAAVKENAIYVRTLFNKETSAGNVAGTGKFAAAGSNVVTTGNADVDRALLNSERSIRQNGGTFTRATGSNSSYTYTQGTGASQFTGSLTAQVNGTINGTYRQSGVTTNYVANAATRAITVSGGNVVSQVTAKLFGSTLLGL